MTVILIEPHMDDAVLFASYTILGERPVVCTALGNTTYGDVRREEHMAALRVLGADRDAWNGNWPENRPDWEDVREWMRDLRNELRPDLVYAPKQEVGGHEQHNMIAEIAMHTFTGCAMSFYMTYRRGDRRSRGAFEFEPKPGWAALKFQAMACYASQIEWIHTRPWFAADDALREWLA